MPLFVWKGIRLIILKTYNAHILVAGFCEIKKVVRTTSKWQISNDYITFHNFLLHTKYIVAIFRYSWIPNFDLLFMIIYFLPCLHFIWLILSNKFCYVFGYFFGILKIFFAASQFLKKLSYQICSYGWGQTSKI